MARGGGRGLAAFEMTSDRERESANGRARKRG